jgi:hypothetical protein
VFDGALAAFLQQLDARTLADVLPPPAAFAARAAVPIAAPVPQRPARADGH